MIAITGLFGRFSAKAAASTHEIDVIVAGSGAAGMTAALTAAKHGLKVVVIDSSAYFGGSTARSGGGIWIRNNPINQAEGVEDSLAEAEEYLAAVAGEFAPRELQRAFLVHGPAMVQFLLDHTPLKFRRMAGYSDYYPELPGGKPDGASIEPEIFDGNLLGSELSKLNPPYIDPPAGVVIYAADYKWLCLAKVTFQGARVAARAVRRYLEACLRRRKPLTMGQALAAGLRAGLMAAGVPVWLDTPLLDLSIDEQGRVDGVRVRQDGIDTLLKAKLGVIVATGGFERNLAMRQEFQKQPIGVDWTLGAVDNTGAGIRAGRRAGADLALMDDAWWGPSVPLAPGQPYFCLSERSLPGSILVNARGLRFVNESAPYHDVVNAMYQQELAADGSGVWLITDQNYRNRYLFRDILPGLALPQAWFDHKAVFKAASLSELAEQIKVPVESLEATVDTFNGYARTGEDLEFRRGDSAYDRYYADPGIKPNPSLGELRKAPFYAFRMVPGDLGTKGGLRTDGHARVLRADGSVIEGLYAAGNASASVMGRSYAGNGSTLGPAMTFGFIAAKAIAAAAGKSLSESAVDAG